MEGGRVAYWSKRCAAREAGVAIRRVCRLVVTIDFAPQPNGRTRDTRRPSSSSHSFAAVARTAAASLSQYGRNVDPRLGIDIDLAERRLAQTALALLSLPHGNSPRRSRRTGSPTRNQNCLARTLVVLFQPNQINRSASSSDFCSRCPRCPPEARMRTRSGGAGASSYCSGTLEAKCQVIAKQRMQIAIDTNPYAVYRSIVPRRSVANIHPITPTITTTHQARSKTWTGDSRLSFSCQRR